jgi:mRNA deadenylase 3'-5' endonuclease subunit Ccr4
MAGRGFEPPLTNKHPSFSGCLDYIWVSKQGLEVVGVLLMPYEQQLGLAAQREMPASAVPFGSIPDAVWASDHLAVGAVLRL